MAVVSTVKSTLNVGNNGIFSGTLTHAEGPTADHPWYAINVLAGQKLDIRLFTDFNSTYWLYNVLDGHAESGDTPFGPTPDLEFLREPDFAGTKFPRISGFDVVADGQLLVQIDSTGGASGRYGLQIERTIPIPEPSSLATLSMIVSLFAFLCRNRWDDRDATTRPRTRIA
jgi:hypothetical protein